MADHKRLLRTIKRELKQAGNRKRRRYLKDVTAVADAFEFGRQRSAVMNLRRTRTDESKPRLSQALVSVDDAR